MKSKLEKLLPKAAFARGVSILVGGTAGAQVLMVLASPILTRLYTPEDFGLLAVYMALLALFTVVASLRYELAIPLPERDAEAIDVLMLSLVAVILMTCISGALVLLAGNHIAHSLGTPDLAKYFWLLPIGVLLSGIYKVFNYWAVRTKQFGVIAKTRIHQTLANLAIQAIGFKLGGVALLIGQSGGQGVGSIRLGRNAFSHPEFSLWRWQGMFKAARKYRQFPIFSTWSSIFNTAGTQLPPLMLAAFFSPGAAGLYALANRILMLPMIVIGRAVGQVFFSDLAEANREFILSSQVKNAVLTLVNLSLPVAAVFMLMAPDFFSLVFGVQWKPAGEAARWMTPWILFQFVSSPISTVYFVLEKENLALYFQVVMFLLRVTSLVIGNIYFEFMGALILFSVVSAACYLAYVLSVLVVSNVSLKSVFYVVARDVLAVILTVAPAIYLYGSGNVAVATVYLLVMAVIFYSPKLKKIYR